MLDKLHDLLGNQKLQQVISIVELLMFYLAELEAPQYAEAIEQIKAFLDKQTPKA